MPLGKIEQPRPGFKTMRTRLRPEQVEMYLYTVGARLGPRRIIGAGKEWEPDEDEETKPLAHDTSAGSSFTPA